MSNQTSDIITEEDGDFSQAGNGHPYQFPAIIQTCQTCQKRFPFRQKGGKKLKKVME